MFIDSTNILNFGYKNKKSIKVSILVDNNRISHIIDISKAFIHDAKIMENNKLQFNLVADIKNDNYITLITPLRVNSKKKLIIY